jgi:hypothetical protein
MRGALIVILLAGACTSPPAGKHVAVAIDVLASHVEVTVNGELVDPGTAGPEHGVDVRDSVDDWSEDIPYKVTAESGGAVIGELTVPPGQCLILCPGTADAPCAPDDVNTEWTQVVVTATSIRQECVRCVGSAGTDVANECPPPQ